MATIFSKIIAGEIPSYKVAEDDRFYAFLDINPLAKGHTLVVPKREVDYIFDLTDEELAAMQVFAKRVALAIILSEVDDHGDEHKRGMKTLTVPAHNGPGCRNVTVRCIKFVLPEDTDEGRTVDTLCGTRHLRARLIANYIDTDFQCCTLHG